MGARGADLSLVGAPGAAIAVRRGGLGGGAGAGGAAGLGIGIRGGTTGTGFATVIRSVAIVDKAGAVGHDVAEVVGAVARRVVFQAHRHSDPFAHPPTAPMRRVFVATPEVASGLVRVT